MQALERGCFLSVTVAPPPNSAPFAGPIGLSRVSAYKPDRARPIHPRMDSGCTVGLVRIGWYFRAPSMSWKAVHRVVKKIPRGRVATYGRPPPARRRTHGGARPGGVPCGPGHSLAPRGGGRRPNPYPRAACLAAKETPGERRRAPRRPSAGRYEPPQLGARQKRRSEKQEKRKGN